MSWFFLQAGVFIGPIPAFHVGDRGSNFLGDAKYAADITGKLGRTNFPVLVDGRI
jgi:hypothetical protein